MVGWLLSNNLYQFGKTEEIKEAKENVKSVIPPFLSRENFVVGGIFGVIKEIKNQEILVESTDNSISLQPKELIDKKWMVKIDKNTKILNRKLDNFSRDETPEGFGMKVPFGDYNITIKDLKIGDYISVDSTENILNVNEFLAKSIIKLTF